MYLPAKLIDKIVCKSSSASKLIRNLLVAFFPLEVLASSSALGSRLLTRSYWVLASVSACGLKCAIIIPSLGFVQQKFKRMARMLLVDATNEKCAQCHRKKL